MSTGRTTIVPLLLAMAGPPALVAVLRRALGESPPLATQFVLHVVFCAIAVALVLVVTRVERRPLASIGVRHPGWTTVVSGLLLGLGTVWLLPLVTHPLVGVVQGARVDAEMRTLALWPVWFRVFVGATSGFVEETIYRGYGVERLAELTGSLWIGGLLAALGFALAHALAWGIGYALAGDLPFGIVMTIFYLWRRDLLANGIAHGTGLVIVLVSLTF